MSYYMPMVATIIQSSDEILIFVLDTVCVFQIWNSTSGELLYKSSIISSSPFEYLIMNEKSEEFILISEDGMVGKYIFRLLNSMKTLV